MKNVTKSTKYSILILFALQIIVLVACSKKDDNPLAENPAVEDYDREPMLKNYANNYIMPAYAAYVTEVTALKNEVNTFNLNLNVAALQNLRLKWESTLLVWQDVAFLEFGPAQNISLRSQTNVYPADTAVINSNIASGSYNLQLASNFDAKGYQAFDYLINGTGVSDNEIVTYFTNSANARTYLVDVINDIDIAATTVNNEWISNYKTNFIANSSSNAQGSSVSNIINALNLHYETYIRKGKVGLPAGVFNGFSQLPMPEHVESYYYQQSLPFVYRSLNSMQKFLKGEHYAASTNGEGLDDYLSYIKAKSGGQALQVLINDQFNVIQAELNNINDPLSNEVTTNNQAVRDVYQEMQVLVPQLKVEMTNALEVMITYQDNDGD
jgi:predicted lipoprotein